MNQQTKYITDCFFKVVCPLCYEKRLVSYQCNRSIKNGDSKGYCKTCSRLKMAFAKFKDAKNKGAVRFCFSCRKEIFVAPINKKGNFICIDCRINKRIALREKHIKEVLEEEERPAVKNKKKLKSISLFGCVLTEQRKRNGQFNYSRCKLGDKCRYFWFCLNKISHLDWKGFTAAGKGHLKSDSLFD